MITILEDRSSSYSPRTYVNAKSAQLTVAFAADFTTAGEKCTHKAAGEAYISISLSDEPIDAARKLFRELRAREVRVLNIAGNGIYTLSKFGWTQDKINAHIFAILSKVSDHWRLDKVVSGGQTGVDMAGVIAATALSINAQALLPKGFIQRGTDKKDVEQSEQLIREQVSDGVAKVLAENERLLLKPRRHHNEKMKNKLVFLDKDNNAWIQDHGVGQSMPENAEFYCEIPLKWSTEWKLIESASRAYKQLLILIGNTDSDAEHEKLDVSIETRESLGKKISEKIYSLDDNIKYVPIESLKFRKMPEYIPVCTYTLGLLYRDREKPHKTVEVLSDRDSDAMNKAIKLLNPGVSEYVKQIDRVPNQAHIEQNNKRPKFK